MKDTKARAAALQRLARIEARLRDLSRSRLAAIKSEEARLDADLEAIFAALETGPFAYGALAKPGLARARSAHIRLDRLQRDEREARLNAERHGLRALAAEKAAAKAARRLREESERKALLDIIERAIARDASQG